MATRAEPADAGIDLTVRVWPDDLDGGYVAECVELPGCMSQGETEAEALANIKDAISEVLASMLDDASPAPSARETSQHPGHEHHVRIDVAA